MENLLEEGGSRDSCILITKWEEIRKLKPEKFTQNPHLIKGFPKHKRGEIRKTISKLIKRGFLQVKPTAYGRQVSLNIERKKEIEEIIARYFEQI